MGVGRHYPVAVENTPNDFTNIITPSWLRKRVESGTEATQMAIRVFIELYFGRPFWISLKEYE